VALELSEGGGYGIWLDCGIGEVVGLWVEMVAK